MRAELKLIVELVNGPDDWPELLLAADYLGSPIQLTTTISLSAFESDSWENVLAMSLQSKIVDLAVPLIRHSVDQLDKKKAIKGV